MSEWIKFDANDKRAWPENSWEIYIFATDGKHVDICVFDNEYKFIDKPGMYDDHPPIEFKNVTHWMPILLPKPPETEG